MITAEDTDLASCRMPSLAQTLQGVSLPICSPTENTWVYMILLVQRILLAVLGAAVLQSMPSKLEMSMIMAVLQSTPSPLEICACIAVVDGSEAKHIQQIINAVTILFLALCGWHVPRVLPYHNLICRFLSAFCMQALFPYSTALSCLAILF